MKKVKKDSIFTSLQVKEIENVELSHGKAKNFFHCKSCMEQFLKSSLRGTMTPREYGMYEVSNYAFMYPGKKRKVDIVVVWCKRCGQSIWDSRNLDPMY